MECEQSGSPLPSARIRATVERYFGVRDEATLESILSELEPVELHGGAWLLRAGETDNALFLIVRGRLQVWGEAETAEGDTEESLLGELGTGESVGEVGLLTGTARSASVRAIRDTVLLRMDRDAFLRLASSHPSLAVELASQIATRLRDRTAARRREVRGPENLVVVPLSGAPEVRHIARELASALEAHGSVQHVDAEGPPRSEHGSLGEWLHTLEAEHDYLVLEAHPELSSWSRLCLRHADAIVLVGRAQDAPSAGAFADADREGASGARRILLLLHPGDAVSHGARWRAAIEPDELHHIRAGTRERDLARLARILAGRAIGLVLGGGAARGFAHVGVYRALHEAGIPVDWVGGSSIGSVFAATVALDWAPPQLETLARQAFVEENPLGDYTLPLVALLRGRRVRRLVLEHFDCDIEDLPIPYFCVSSHLERGELDVHERGHLWRAVRASVALPGVLPPAVVDGHLAIDGGVLNNLPVDVMRSRRVGHVIAVDLSVQKDRPVKYEEVPSPFEILRGSVFPTRRRPSVPNIFSLMIKASLVASAGHSRAMRSQADLLLRPPVASFGLLDVRAFDRLVEVGYEHARERVAEWKPPVPS
ncbi:MAG: cyclic nucleotide-binding and patatin-like phospholipase domain-containing protein [Myxococcota bacterium]|nr:cyclic nucleotide-binding and patatin-like phospholipase domain-containing protein [Myxococcota bacterium]